jgi:hypothetical protein
MNMESKPVATLKCESCGKRGIIAWAQKVHPVFRHRELEAISRGFLLVDTGSRGDPHFECVVCRSPALMIGAPTGVEFGAGTGETAGPG